MRRNVFVLSMLCCVAVGVHAQEMAPVWTPFTVPPTVKNSGAVRTRMTELHQMLPVPRPEGTTRIWLHIDERGTIKSMRLKESSGNASVDSVAFQVARIFEFT